MAEHIGIVACSAEGAALCYRTICTEGPSLMGEGYAHPEITMHTFNLGEYTRYFEADDWEGVAGLMVASAEKVAGAGADFAICPDNTIHQAYDMVVEKSPIPWLHIAEEVAAEAGRRNYKRLGILGTRYLMEGPVYAEKLTAVSIEYRIPGEKEREYINGVIFNELVFGRFTAEAREKFEQIIGGLREKGCDAVVLGCTEIPLLMTQEKLPLPALDSTRLLARAALKKAVRGKS